MKNKHVRSKILTSTGGQVTLYPGKLRDITFVSDGANAGTVKILNNSTDGTGGTEIWYGSVAAVAGDTFFASFPDGKSFVTNCWAVLANVTKASVGYTDNS